MSVLNRRDWQPGSLLRQMRDGIHRPTLMALLSVDLGLVLLHSALGYLLMVNALDAIPDLLRIDRDFGLGETFGYAKWAALVAIMVTAYLRSRAPVFLALAALWLFALADDSLQLHENVALAVLSRLPSKTIDTGVIEVAFFIAAGAILMLPASLALIRSTARQRLQIAPLILLFAGVVACGMGVDFVHSLVEGNTLIAGILGIIEDGGEMVFMSAMLAYALGTFGLPARASDRQRGGAKDGAQRE